ncbi:MAG: dihydropteroate synthase, partial [Paracoccaceae bacterium]|nr:dihydropteroate synthase [Paracoccaceae bacterium]
SFSDGGKFDDATKSVPNALQMISDGADILDIGGESTRPGAQEVTINDEIARTKPIVAAIRQVSDVPISIDTRKSKVAASAIEAGATMLNDVSAFQFDPEMQVTVANAGLPVCLMHAQGSPETMQENPNYDEVLLDVYDYLRNKVEAAAGAGIPRSHIIVDPGVGFGKTLDHNLSLLRGISLFHSLGCAILLGVSRKRFIGTIGNTSLAADRMAGSVAVGMAAVSQGVQILRVHDVAETRQALSLHQAVTTDRG